MAPGSPKVMPAFTACVGGGDIDTHMGRRQVEMWPFRDPSIPTRGARHSACNQRSEVVTRASRSHGSYSGVRATRHCMTTLLNTTD